MIKFKTPRRPFARQDAKPRELKRGAALREANPNPRVRVFYGNTRKQALNNARRWAMAAALVLTPNGMSTEPVQDKTGVNKRVVFQAVQRGPQDFVAQARPEIVSANRAS